MSLVVFRGRVSGKYVQKVLDPTKPVVSEILSWTSNKSEAWVFEFPTAIGTPPKISDIEGSRKWHEKKKAVAEKQQQLMEFQQQGNLDMEEAPEGTG